MNNNTEPTQDRLTDAQLEEALQKSRRTRRIVRLVTAAIVLVVALVVFRGTA